MAEADNGGIGPLPQGGPGARSESKGGKAGRAARGAKKGAAGRKSGGRGGARAGAGPQAPRGGGGGGTAEAVGGAVAPRAVGGPFVPRAVGGPLVPRAVGGVVIPRAIGGPVLGGGMTAPGAVGGPVVPRHKLDPRLVLAAVGGPLVGKAVGGPLVPKGKKAAAPKAAPAKGATIVPATSRALETTTGGNVTVPASVSGMPVARQGLMAQASVVEGARLRANRVSVLVDATDAQAVAQFAKAAKGPGVEVRALAGSVAVARLPTDQLAALAHHPQVRFVEANARLKPTLDRAHLSANLVAAVGGRTAEQTGQGVLIGVVDTGIDLAHPGFNRAPPGAGSRVVDYLDQTTGARHAGASLTNGAAAAASPDFDGHGTHVAGIAAGSGEGSHMNRYAGVAPDADLAVVKTTFDTVAIAEAVAHVFDVAAQRNQPCVINLSLGGHYGAHDGSSLLERTIDTLCEGPGRVVVVSAGNEGDARIHTSTELPRGAATPARWVANFELTQQVVDNTLMGLMWLQVWTLREDALLVTLRSPNGELFRPPQNSQGYEDRGKFAVSVSHQVAPYSRDNVFTFGVFAVPQSQWLQGWSVIVEEDRSGGAVGVEVGDVHAWILGEEMGRFTGAFTRSHLVGMPGTAFSAITVASYATKGQWNSQDPDNPVVELGAVKPEDISYFSSPGPTRERQNKPDIAAPGQWLVSALSGAATPDAIPLWLRLPEYQPGVGYAAMQGTSMAAPYVTGAVALLMQKHRDVYGIDIHWAEVKRRLIKTAKLDRYSTPCWNERWGWGKIDVEALLTVEPGG